MKQIEKIEVEELKETSRRSPLFRFAPERPSGKDVLEVKGLSKAYGDNQVLRDMSFIIRRGEKVAVIGPNGLGKSTLLKIITGNVEADRGDVARAIAAQAANPAPTMAPATEAETEAEAEERKRNYEQQRKEYEQQQERRAEESRLEDERREKEWEGERARREKLQKARTAKFDRILDGFDGPDPSSLRQGGTEEMLDGFLGLGAAIVGDPDDVVAQIARWEATGADQFLMLRGVKNKEQTLRMLRLMGEHVIPKFDKDPVHRTTRLRAAAAGNPIPA